MAFRSKFIILLVVMFMIITELECRTNNTKRMVHRKRTHVSPSPTFPTMDYGVSSVVENASGVFTKLIAKMMAKKKLVGFDSGWYW